MHSGCRRRQWWELRIFCRRCSEWSCSTVILQDRQPLVNIYEALAMTVPGIVAHQSALKDGERLKVPQFDPPAL